MKIIYIPDDYHLIVNIMTKTLARRYDRDGLIYVNRPEHFKLINIIISLTKDEIQISSLFNYDLSLFTIVETQENYYIGMNMYTACDIAYRSTLQTDFSNTLHQCIEKIIPNIFNSTDMISHFKNRQKTSVKSLNYFHMYMEIMDDVYIMSNTYMDILKRCRDLDREGLNRLFKITVKYLISIERLNKIQSIKTIDTISNTYNFYQNKFHDFIEFENNQSFNKNITQYLKCISENDRYTNNDVEVRFSTSISTINKFTQTTCNSYKHSLPEIIKTLPITTTVDMFMSISIEDIERYSDNQQIGHLKELFLFRNDYMDFALYGNKENDYYG